MNEGANRRGAFTGFLSDEIDQLVARCESLLM